LSRGQKITPFVGPKATELKNPKPHKPKPKLKPQ